MSESDRDDNPFKAFEERQQDVLNSLKFRPNYPPHDQLPPRSSK